MLGVIRVLKSLEIRLEEPYHSFKETLGKPFKAVSF